MSIVYESAAPEAGGRGVHVAINTKFNFLTFSSFFLVHKFIRRICEKTIWVLRSYFILPYLIWFLFTNQIFKVYIVRCFMLMIWTFLKLFTCLRTAYYFRVVSIAWRIVVNIAFYNSIKCNTITFTRKWGLYYLTTNYRIPF